MTSPVIHANPPTRVPGTCARWTGAAWCGRTDIVATWQIGPLCREHAPDATPARIPGCECRQCARPEDDPLGATINEAQPGSADARG